MTLDLTPMLTPMYVGVFVKLLESGSDSAIAVVGPNGRETPSVYFAAPATVLNHSAISTRSLSAARLAASTPP